MKIRPKNIKEFTKIPTEKGFKCTALVATQGGDKHIESEWEYYPDNTYTVTIKHNDHTAVLKGRKGEICGNGKKRNDHIGITVLDKNGKVISETSKCVDVRLDSSDFDLPKEWM